MNAIGRYYFPDTTSLINFHVVERFDLLEVLVHESARWTLSIERECAHQDSDFPGLYGASRGIFGDPIVPTPAELVTASAIRNSMAGPGDGPTKHLGEAETIAVISTRSASSPFITDDEGAHNRARADGIAVYGTLDLLTVLVTQRKIDDDERIRLEQVLRRNDRHPRAWTS